jgi:hypothetical protein
MELLMSKLCTTCFTNRSVVRIDGEKLLKTTLHISTQVRQSVMSWGDVGQ